MDNCKCNDTNMYNRMKESWKDCQGTLKTAKTKGIRESAMEDICKFILLNVFGYDTYKVETQEGMHVLDSVDFSLKDPETGKIVWIVESKTMNEYVDEGKWVDQIGKYCLKSKTNWAILTNGLKWAIYYKDINAASAGARKVYEIDDITVLSATEKDMEKLYPFTKEALKNGVREKLLSGEIK